jgi:hypothetical protein
VLLNWANTPYKPLAGQVVFYNTAMRMALETIAFTAGECVQYAEQFESGNGDDGAYCCQLMITAPSFELRAGGPSVPAGVAAVAAAVPAVLSTVGGSNPAASLVAGQVGGGGENLGSTAAGAAAAAQELNLLSMAKAVNPTKGMTNCSHITEAVVARLHGTDPNAVAPDAPTRTIPEIQAIHNTTFEFGAGFHQAFNTISQSPEGTIGLLVMVPKTAGQMGHIVTIVNHKGVPTIIEGQHWDAYNPAETITSSTRAMRRYGDEDKVHLGLAIVPPPAAMPA